MGRQADAVMLYAELAKEPYRYDFYQTLRRLECLHDPKPRWGEALRPVDEPVRLGQDPELTFAPASLSSFETQNGRVPHLQVRLFGLCGPNGPLPLHLTEYARERLRGGDPTLSRFLDIFHHRFLALFYRAWAQAQPHVNRDRPASDRFTVYVGSFLGMASPVSRDRDALPDLARFFHAGTLIRQVRNAEGLRQIIEHFFGIPARIEEFVGHWLLLAASERTYLSSPGATLGSGAVIGGRVWDRQHKFRIHLGPLTLAQYQSFLPRERRLEKLMDWVRTYLCFELDWDVRLHLKPDHVPLLRLDGQQRLGWTTWLGRRRSAAAADDLCIDAESVVSYGVRAA